MISQTAKNEKRKRVHARIRRKISGRPERPRICIFRSLKHFSVQAIDDLSGTVLVSASTNDKELRPRIGNGGNVSAAKEVGKILAERAIAKGIRSIVLDRGGYLYHGRIKAFAEAARESGLEF